MSGSSALVREGILALVLVIALVMANAALAADPVVILNEFVASNSKGLQDEDLDYSDWIELKNISDQSVNLDGWSLTVDRSVSRQWMFPPVTIDSGQYLVVFASGKNRQPADGSNLHTNFVLSRDGEFLALINREGKSPPGAIFDPEFIKQKADQSYGIHPTEAGYWFFATPSPGSANLVAAFPEVARAPDVSLKRGFYATAISVALSSANLGAKIYYTLDGRDPDPETGTLYTGPVWIKTTSVLRSRSFRPDLAPSRIETHTYLINASAAIKSLPVLSVVGDAKQSLYEPNGIMAIVGGHYGVLGGMISENHLWVADGPGDYNNPMQRGRAFERPVSVEYLRADGSADFQIDAGIRVGGSDSHRKRYRRRDGNWLDCSFPEGMYSKFTLKAFFRNVYGAAKLRFPLIPEARGEVFDALSLRAGMQDWCNPFSKDELIRRLRHDMGGIVALGTMVNLFINGEYKTYINLTERYEENTLQNWFQTDNGFDILTQRYRDGKVVRSGDDIAWRELLDYVANYDLSIPVQYRGFGQMLDIPAFIDYLIIQLYSQNTDWPINNWTVARERRSGAKWRYYLWDAEASFRSLPDLLAPDSTWTHFDRFPHWRPNSGTGLNGENDAISRIYRALKASPQFRQLFADHLGRHFFNGGALSDRNIRRRFHELRNVLRGVIPNGDRYFVDSFVPRRRDIVLDASVNEGLFTFEGPAFSIDGSRQHGGAINEGQSLALSNRRGSGTIAYTLDGNDPLQFKQTFFRSLVTDSSTRYVLVPTSSKAAPTGINGRLGANAFWIRSSGGVGYENDRDGKQRVAKFAPFIGLDVGRQMYGVNGSCFVRIPFTIDRADLGRFDNLTLRMRYDDGYVAYINGTEVARRNAPDTLVWNSRAKENRPDHEAVLFEDTDLSNFISLLNEGENMLAIHGLNSGARSSDFLIATELNASESGSGKMLSPTAVTYTGAITLTESTHVKARIWVNNTWSALNEAVFTAPSATGSVRITELMYHPPERAAEYIELQNVGKTSMDLTGATFSDAIGFSFPMTVLQAGEIIVLVSDQDLVAFQALYPEVTVFGTYLQRLNNAGETVTLVAADGVTVLDSLSYDDAAPWPTRPDGSGYSLDLFDPVANRDGPGAWRASTDVGGSPGGKR